MKRTTSPRRWMRAAVVLGAGIATLLAAEGTLRLLEGPAHERVRVEYGFVEALPGQDVHGFPPNGQARFQWDGDPYGVLPDGARIDVRLNAAGLRGPLPTGQAPSVLFVGDSFTFGEGVTLEETFVERLREPLRAAGAEPVNAGVPGYGTREQTLLFRRWLTRFRPGAVVLVFVLNDPIPLGRSLDRGEDLMHATGARSGLRLAGLLERRRADDATEDWYRSYYTGAENAHWRAAREALPALRAEAERAGARFGVALFPLLHELEDYPFGDLHAEVAGACEQGGIPFLDLLPAFAGWDTASLWVHPTDHHPNREAHALAAKALGPFVTALLGD